MNHLIRSRRNLPVMLVALFLCMAFFTIGSAQEDGTPTGSVVTGENVDASDKNLWDRFPLSGSWTEIIQGHLDPEVGGCVYQFELQVPINEARRVVSFTKAVDLDTCQFEIQFGYPIGEPEQSHGGIIEADEVTVGVVDGVDCEHHEGHVHDEDWAVDCPDASPTSAAPIEPGPTEQIAVPEQPTSTINPIEEPTQERTPAADDPIVVTLPPQDDSSPVAVVLPGATVSDFSNQIASVDTDGLGGQDRPARMTHLNQKASYWIWWEDPANIDVSGVSAAVRSNSSGSNITGAACLHERKLYDPSNPISSAIFTEGWRTSHTNPRFNSWDCWYTPSWAQSTVGAHHYNNDFYACLGQTVHLYYEKAYVAVDTNPSHVWGYFHVGYWGVWKSGATYTCGWMLDGAYSDFMPGEYFRKWSG